MYIITDYKKAEDGFGYAADLPDGIWGGGSFAGLSHGTKEQHGFVLVHVMGLVSEKTIPPMERVRGELELLLYAGEMYPPAIAIARDAVRYRPELLTREVFKAILIEKLRTLLIDQPRSPFFIARCISASDSYKSSGSYYWIVGWCIRRGQTMLEWISSDYFVYKDRLTDFDVTEDFLRERFGEPRQPKRGIPRTSEE